MKNKKIKVSELLFFSSWYIYMFSYILLNQTEFTAMYNTAHIYKFFKATMIGILFLKLFIVDKYSFNKIILYVAIIGIFFINVYIAKTEFLFFMVIFILASKDVNFEKFIKFDIKLRIAILFLILGLCFLGFIPNFTSMINGSYKQAFGFYHPNTLAMFVISIILEWIYILKERMRLYHIIMIIVILIIINSICKARTSLYTFCFVFSLYLIFYKRKNILKNKKVFFVLYLLPIIMIILTYLSIYFYNHGYNFMIKIDKILTTRIMAGNLFYETYGISTFGREIETIGTRQALAYNKAARILDMGYLHIAINNGVIILLALLIALIMIQRKAIKNNNMQLLFYNTFFIISGFAETYMYIIAFNAIYISLFGFLEENRNGKNQ